MEKNIRDLTLEELKEGLREIGAPSYRAEQIFFWLYRKGIDDFNKMLNLPEKLRYALNEKYSAGLPRVFQSLKGKDGTEKFLFELEDGNFIESVFIRSSPRKTICISTQVGCKFNCAFCASGFGGFARNLAPAEILNQILSVQHSGNHIITNYVFMGMGEPLDNFDNVSKAIKIMNDPHGMNIGARRITISTCGIIPGIEKLANLDLQVNLSVSLHASDDSLRDELVPVNKRYPIRKLIESCKHYTEKTKRMITLEYILLDKKNDTEKDADKLAVISKRLKAKVNLIPASIVPGLGFRPSTKTRIDVFKKLLAAKKVNVTLRESKGKDIQAACGQLAGRNRQVNNG